MHGERAGLSKGKHKLMESMSIAQAHGPNNQRAKRNNQTLPCKSAETMDFRKISGFRDPGFRDFETVHEVHEDQTKTRTI